MKALSIRQPWAWLIVRPDLTDPAERAAVEALGEIKDIENRTWMTRQRGTVLIHASQGMTRGEYEDVVDFLLLDPRLHDVARALPAHNAIERGGIVGQVEIVDCVRESGSPWFFGPAGFLLRNARPLPFHKTKGALGFFDVSMPAESTEAKPC